MVQKNTVAIGKETQHVASAVTAQKAVQQRLVTVG